MTEAYILALDEVMRRTSGAPRECMDDLCEAMARRVANSSSSRYEHPAASAWPSLAQECPTLTARIHLAPSGLASYSLVPGPCPSAEGSAAAWKLSGEAWWRVLPPDGRPTEVVLE